jgi:hypothetical protein
MPEIGSTIKVSGTFHRIMWNQRPDDLVPILDDATIEIVEGPSVLAAPGASCNLDQECNARLICDRASHTCTPPPREIYWADPWHDVNGACDTDADCPLGQTCDPSYTIPATGDFGAHYFVAADVGRHSAAEPGRGNRRGARGSTRARCRRPVRERQGDLRARDAAVSVHAEITIHE